MSKNQGVIQLMHPGGEASKGKKSTQCRNLF